VLDYKALRYKFENDARIPEQASSSSSSSSFWGDAAAGAGAGWGGGGAEDPLLAGARPGLDSRGISPYYTDEHHRYMYCSFGLF